MHYRKLLKRALSGSFAAFFVFVFGFYAFSAFALSDLSKSLNTNIHSNTNGAVAETDVTTRDEGSAVAVTEPILSTATQTTKDLVVLMDASGSMSENFGDVSKLDAAKAALEQGVDKLGGDYDVSLYAAGSKESSQDKEKSCIDVADLTEGSTKDMKSIKSAINKVASRGNAPIAFGISELSTSFDTQVAEKTDHIVLIIVDGADNCDGDVVKASEDLLAAHPGTIFYTIGLNVESDVGRDLQQVAENGSGQYFSVNDQNGLTAAVLVAANKVAASTKGTTVDTSRASAVSAGGSFEKARVFTESDFGKTYTLKNHLNADQLEYWKIDLLPGQGATITVETGDKDVSFTEGDAKETDDAPSAGITVFDEKELALFDVAIQQEKNTEKSGMIFSVSADKESHTFYLGVGYSLPVHKDMKYVVTLEEEYDEPTINSDAANVLDEPLVSLKEGVQSGFLSKSDPADFYTISVGNGQTANVSASPVDLDSKIGLEFYDGAGDLIESARSDVAGKSVSLSYAASEDAVITVGISEVTGEYAIDVSIEGDRIKDEADVAPIISTNSQDLINVDQARGQSGLSDTFIKWAIIVGVALALFVVLLVIVFLLLSRKKNKYAQSKDNKMEKGTDVSKKDVVAKEMPSTDFTKSESISKPDSQN